ncbi:MAG: HNH endonuclease [Gammaproteobacteria bacterium]
MSGGYNKKARLLSREIREAVLRRSKGKCEICGKEGSDIDHIKGSSSDFSNLQLLCKSCHNAKTEKSIVPVEPGSERYEYVRARTEQFWLCVESDTPIRICHDENKWKSVWRTFAKERKAYALEI